MTPPPLLAPEFRSHLSARLSVPEDPRELEDVLRGALAKAATAWPTVRISPDAFIRYLAGHMSEEHAGKPLGDVLAELPLHELYLACACALGDEPAILAFDRYYLSALPGKLAKLNLSKDVLDDTLQNLRETMLVRNGARGPRIGDYAGRGSLLNWLKVAATRAAVKIAQQGRFAAEDDMAAVMDALPAPGLDAEMDLLKRRYRPHFENALRLAFSELIDDERHLLRLHYSDGLSETRMAEVLGKSQPTVSRHLRKVKAKIHDVAKRQLKQSLKLSSREFESLMKDLRSQLELSISKMLGGG